MSMYGFFAAPTLGMLTQSSAFGSISQNITNMNTGGYKASHTRFHTILASTYDNNSDVGGVKAIRKNLVENQGRIISTGNKMDVAIDGKGMYVLNTKVDGSGETFYTRDGAFELFAGDQTVSISGASNLSNESYIVDKNGYFLQGWAADGNGAISTSSATQSLRVDNDAFSSNNAAAAAATTTGSLAANLPATLAAGETKVTKASVFDSAGGLRSFELIWTRGSAAQEWTMTVNPDNGTSTSTATYTFDSTGKLPNGTTTTIAIDYTTDPDVSFTLDVSDLTSISDNFLYFDFQKDGRAPGELSDFRFDETGKIIGSFTNGLEQTLYKLPLAIFANADGLDNRQSNLFTQTVESGTPALIEVKAASSTDVFNEYAEFIPYTHELSNTNLQNEFTFMILSQQAYNSAATVFKTVDEMTSVAAELKS